MPIIIRSLRLVDRALPTRMRLHRPPGYFHAKPTVFSVFVGLSSIACWLVAQAPQMWTNYKIKKSEQLSFFFLFQWFLGRCKLAHVLGDATNLVGCILTHQNPTQFYTAIYFCTIDIAMLSQYLYYMHIYPKRLVSCPV